MTTKTYDGKVYEIGKIYEFSDDGEIWVVSKLTSVDSSRYPFNFDGDNCCSKLCREINPDSLGKITKAKIEPEVGKVYKISDGIRGNYVEWSRGDRLDDDWEIICEMVEKTEGEE